MVMIVIRGMNEVPIMVILMVILGIWVVNEVVTSMVTEAMLKMTGVM